MYSFEGELDAGIATTANVVDGDAEGLVYIDFRRLEANTVEWIDAIVVSCLLYPL